MAEDRIRQSLLLDFYGELLTERQRSCYELHVNDDLSLTEIAEQCGISRQGVWDNIRRAESALDAIEQKTGLIARFTDTAHGLDALERKLQTLSALTEGEARGLVNETLHDLKELRDGL
jgi:predicted DNA-binding protein YlxM (UPF0122 family)